jgi:hypothetical protein
MSLVSGGGRAGEENFRMSSGEGIFKEERSKVKREWKTQKWGRLTELQ